MVDPQISAAICDLLNEVDTTSTDRLSLRELRQRIALRRAELCGCPEVGELQLIVISLDRVLFDIDVRIIDLQHPRFSELQSSGAPTADVGGL